MSDNSTNGAGFHGRLFVAWMRWQTIKGRRLTQAELGERVGELRGEPVAQSTVSDWFKRGMPSLREIVTSNPS